MERASERECKSVKRNERTVKKKREEER